MIKYIRPAILINIFVTSLVLASVQPASACNPLEDEDCTEEQQSLDQNRSDWAVVNAMTSYIKRGDENSGRQYHRYPQRVRHYAKPRYYSHSRNNSGNAIVPQPQPNPAEALQGLIL